MPTNFLTFLTEHDYLFDFSAEEGRLDELEEGDFAGTLEVWRKNTSEPVLVARRNASDIFAAIVANYSAKNMNYETAVTLLTALENDLPPHFYEEHSSEIKTLLTQEHYNNFFKHNYSFAG